jgi:hypothetical protein
LQKALRRTFVNAIANDETEKVGAYDSEDASNDRANQPLEANASQADFKENNRDSEEHSNARGRPAV